MSDITVLHISGGIWKTSPVSETPELELSSWRVMQTETGERHFVGYNLTEGEGRVSSAIQTFDKDTMRGVTRTGRVYQLVGSPGFNSDAMYVWGRWKRINEVTEELDVSEELV